MLSGRGIAKIVVSPTDPNVIFVASAQGTAGIGGSTAGMVPPNAGIYRTTAAMSASPVFEKLTIQGTTSVSRNISDLVIDPADPIGLIAAIVGGNNDGGVYLSTNALVWFDICPDADDDRRKYVGPDRACRK